MRIGKSSNPTLGKRSLTRVLNSEAAQTGTMTIRGTVNKMLLSLGLVFASAVLAWQQANNGHNYLMYIGAIGGFILAMVTIFKAEWAQYTTPIYSLLEGLFLGSISAHFNAMFPGIVFQAVVLTFGVAFTMLFAYRMGLLKASGKFKRGIIAATGGIAIFYIVSIISSFWGGGIHLGEMGLLGIGIQVVIVAIAALNLILDFDLIERFEEQGAPKIMEWYGAFSLMVTLVWLYVEILRLLSLFSSRD